MKFYKFGDTWINLDNVAVVEKFDPGYMRTSTGVKVYITGKKQPFELTGKDADNLLLVLEQVTRVQPSTPVEIDEQAIAESNQRIKLIKLKHNAIRESKEDAGEKIQLTVQEWRDINGILG